MTPPNTELAEAIDKMSRGEFYDGDLVEQAARAHLATLREDKGVFKIGDTVRKKGNKGQWRGFIVGTYSTKCTPEGYAVESVYEDNSVQIYPASALEPWVHDISALKNPSDAGGIYIRANADAKPRQEKTTQFTKPAPPQADTPIKGAGEEVMRREIIDEINTDAGNSFWDSVNGPKPKREDVSGEEMEPPTEEWIDARNRGAEILNKYITPEVAQTKYRGTFDIADEVFTAMQPPTPAPIDAEVREFDMEEALNKSEWAKD